MLGTDTMRLDVKNRSKQSPEPLAVVVFVMVVAVEVVVANVVFGR